MVVEVITYQVDPILARFCFAGYQGQNDQNDQNGPGIPII